MKPVVFEGDIYLEGMMDAGSLVEMAGKQW